MSDTAPPVALPDLDFGQLRKLLTLLAMIAFDDMATEEDLLLKVKEVRDDPQLLTWLWDKCGGEVVDEQSRQRKILDATEVELAGGHLLSATVVGVGGVGVGVVGTAWEVTFGSGAGQVAWSRRTATWSGV